MRTRRIIASTLGALTTAGAIAAGGMAAGGMATGAEAGSVPRPDSGIHGHVVLAPTCPVERPGRICARPYAARIAIRREPAGTLAVRVRSGSDGDFTVRLRPGRYLLKPGNGSPYPRARRTTVTVRAHHFTKVTIRFDSGIR